MRWSTPPVFLFSLLLCLSSVQAATVPEVSMDKVPLRDVLSFLKTWMLENEPNQPAISFIYIEPEAVAMKEAIAASTSADSFDADFAAPTVESIADQPISLQLSNVPVGEVVRYACELAGASYRLENGGVCLVGKAEDLKSVLESRSFRRQKAPASDGNLKLLNATPIPSLELQNTAVAEAADLLESWLPATANQRAINIVVREGGARSISLNLSNRSVLDTLNYATDQTRLGYRIDPFAIVIGAPERLAAAAPAGDMPASLRAQLVPEVDLQDVTLSEVVDLVNAGGSANILMGEGAGDQRLTLSLRNVPISEVLRYAVELTDCSLSANGKTIRITISEGE